MAVMDETYHVQHQARRFAGQILPVPESYPLRSGLEEGYPAHFAQLCALAKGVYLDMAKDPEAYGLMLVDAKSSDHNLARDGMRSIHRFADLLSALFLCGSVQNHVLTVPMPAFLSAAKSITKLPPLLAKLSDFGFAISALSGKDLDKTLPSFTVQFPSNPFMVDTVKAYCECWDALRDDRREVKLSPKEFHHHFYRFDYKITADLSKIPMAQWLADEADYSGYSPAQKAFSIAFYEHSLRYKGLKFDGEYYYKSKRIARIAETEFFALGASRQRLSLKLSDVDAYRALVESLPASLKEPFEKDSCSYCGFQGSTAEFCKFRQTWSLHDRAHVGCAFQCFFFDDFDKEKVPLYFKLLELAYGLRRDAQVKA